MAAMRKGFAENLPRVIYIIIIIGIIVVLGLLLSRVFAQSETIMGPIPKIKACREATLSLECLLKILGW